MALTMAKVKLFDILDDMRKAFPEYADTLGKEFDDETMLVRKPGPAETIDVQPSEHIIVGRISTIAVDTYKEVLFPEGMDISHYEKNNVVLWGHNYLDYLPHGENVWLTPYPRKKPHEVRAASKYYQDQQRGREVYSHREQRRPLGYSVGYVPLKDITEDHGDTWKEVLEKWQDRYAEYKGGDISKRSMPKPQLFTLMWLLLEYSDVVVAANSDAVQIYVQKGFITDEEALDYTLPEPSLKPYPDEHACRLEDPDKYDRFARKNCEQEHDDKCIDVIYGIKEGKSEIQALRYPKEVWTASAARAHCKSRDGLFEAAKASAADIEQMQLQIDDIQQKLDTLVQPSPELVEFDIEDVRKGLSEASAETFEPADPPKPPEPDAISDLNISDFLQARQKGKLI